MNMNLKSLFKNEKHVNCWNPTSTYKFQDNWTLNDGHGNVSFKGKGRDVYIQVNNQMSSDSHQYWLVINGWDNTKSRLTRGNGTEVCFTDSPKLDLNKTYNYKVHFDKKKATVTVYLDGEKHWSCKDENGWNANNAQYFSIAKYDGANFEICKLQVDCWIPDPNSFHFQKKWKLGAHGAGEIHFTATGRDAYIRLNDEKDSSTFYYWIVINGWENTKSRITRSDDSTVCFPDVSALDLNQSHNYRVAIVPHAATISVFIDGQPSFTCTDPNGWAAKKAKVFSLSRYSGANLEICDIKTSKDVCWSPDPNTYQSSKLWTLGNNGNGEITFNGKGRDVYIRINDDTEKFFYWIVINGWNNTQSRITRSDDSTVCQPNVDAIDTNKFNNYKIELNKSQKEITVFINGSKSFSCKDTQGWKANNATRFTLSRYSGADFEICNVDSHH